MPLNKNSIEGLKSIASYVGLVGTDNRKRLKVLIDKEGMPVKKVGGRWYAEKALLKDWYDNKFIKGGFDGCQNSGAI